MSADNARAAINENPRRAVISTVQMVQDRRLARMFAHVGELVRAWNTDNGDLDLTIVGLYQDLVDIAPEFCPPDEDDGPYEEAWQRLVTEATS